MSVSVNLKLPISKGRNWQKLAIEFCRSDLRAFVFVQQKSQQKMVASYVSGIRHPRGYTYCTVQSLSSVLPKKLSGVHTGLTFQQLSYAYALAICAWQEPSTNPPSSGYAGGQGKAYSGDEGLCSFTGQHVPHQSWPTPGHPCPNNSVS